MCEDHYHTAAKLEVARLSSREIAALQTMGIRIMPSRLSGNLAAYTLTEHYGATERFEGDMNAIKTQWQEQLDQNSVDVTVEDVKQIRAVEYDYIMGQCWVPVEIVAASDGSLAIETAGLSLMAVVALRTLILVLITLAITAVVVCWSIRTYILGPYPKFVCDICGWEFDNSPALTAHRRATHPEVAPYQCPYCGQGFETGSELEKHTKECALKPPDNSWLATILIIAGIVATIVIVPPIIRLANKTKEKTT